jgi:hypothetical protein
VRKGRARGRAPPRIRRALRSRLRASPPPVAKAARRAGRKRGSPPAATGRGALSRGLFLRPSSRTRAPFPFLAMGLLSRHGVTSAAFGHKKRPPSTSGRFVVVLSVAATPPVRLVIGGGKCVPAAARPASARRAKSCGTWRTGRRPGTTSVRWCGAIHGVALASRGSLTTGSGEAGARLESPTFTEP